MTGLLFGKRKELASALLISYAIFVAIFFASRSDLERHPLINKCNYKTKRRIMSLNKRKPEETKMTVANRFRFQILSHAKFEEMKLLFSLAVAAYVRHLRQLGIQRWSARPQMHIKKRNFDFTTKAARATTGRMQNGAGGLNSVQLCPLITDGQMLRICSSAPIA